MQHSPLRTLIPPNGFTLNRKYAIMYVRVCHSLEVYESLKCWSPCWFKIHENNSRFPLFSDHKKERVDRVIDPTPDTFTPPII